jgi:hypothetical protein
MSYISIYQHCTVNEPVRHSLFILSNYLYSSRYVIAYSFPELRERARKRDAEAAKAERSTDSTDSDQPTPARKRVGGVFQYKKKRKELSSSDSEGKQKERKRKRKEKRRKAAAAAEQDSSSVVTSDSEMEEEKTPPKRSHHRSSRRKEKKSPPPPEKEKRTVTSETIDPVPREPVLMCEPTYDNRDETEMAEPAKYSSCESDGQEAIEIDGEKDEMAWKPLNAVETEKVEHTTYEKSR